MNWTPLSFGKHLSKTLPQVLVADPDWFFWAIEKGILVNRGQLARESCELNARARRVRIPERFGPGMVVEYRMDPSRPKFVNLEIVAESWPAPARAFRGRYIDFSIPRQLCPYDKSGYKCFVREIKHLLFGSSRLRARIYEQFFEDEQNFCLDGLNCAS